MKSEYLYNIAWEHNNIAWDAFIPLKNKSDYAPFDQRHLPQWEVVGGKSDGMRIWEEGGEEGTKRGMEEGGGGKFSVSESAIVTHGYAHDPTLLITVFSFKAVEIRYASKFRTNFVVL